VFSAGTRTLLGVGLTDTGSGYNTQSLLPVHIGLPDARKVDIEVIYPGAGSREATLERGVDPRTQGGRPVRVRIDGGDQ